MYLNKLQRKVLGNVEFLIPIKFVSKKGGVEHYNHDFTGGYKDDLLHDYKNDLLHDYKNDLTGGSENDLVDDSKNVLINNAIYDIPKNVLCRIIANELYHKGVISVLNRAIYTNDITFEILQQMYNTLITDIVNPELNRNIPPPTPLPNMLVDYIPKDINYLSCLLVNDLASNLEETKKKITTLFPNISITITNSNTLDKYENKTFDLIICIDYFYNLLTPETIKKMASNTLIIKTIQASPTLDVEETIIANYIANVRTVILENKYERKPINYFTLDKIINIFDEFDITLQQSTRLYDYVVVFELRR